MSYDPNEIDQNSIRSTVDNIKQRDKVGIPQAIQSKHKRDNELVGGRDALNNWHARGLVHSI